MPTTPVHLAYGLTEVRIGFLKRGHDGLFNRIATVAPGLELEVVDDRGESVGEGEAGEIVVRGRGLMQGYWQESKKNRSALDRRGFRTGDRGRIDEEGEIELQGRLEDVLEIGENKIIPGELEMMINRHPAVVESAVVGERSEEGVRGSALHAFVVPRKGSKLEENELISYCREHLEFHQVPSRFHLRTSLPKSPVGKVLRHQLATSIN